MLNIKDRTNDNQYFDASTISAYLTDYALKIHAALLSVDRLHLNKAKDLMTSQRIFIGGNGGSSAISDHWACDFEKGAKRPVVSLSSRPALLSALANDFGYEYTLSWQLAQTQCGHRDTVILISSSGNSPNIMEAAKYAKSQGSKVLGLTGFDGGALRKLSDVSLHVDVNNYGVVEDCHQALMHILAQFHQIKHGS